MIVINDDVVRTFIRIQLYALKSREETVTFVTQACHGLYQESEIEMMTDNILSEGLSKNKEVVDKMMGMLKSFAIPEYEGLNRDDNGMDESDRIMLDVIQSIGDKTYKLIENALDL